MKQFVFGCLPISVVLSICCIGCVTTPYNSSGGVGCNFGNMDFEGYTYSPSATVTVYAWNYDEEQWDVLGTTTSDSEASTLWVCGEDEMYEYSATVYTGDSEYSDCDVQGCDRKFKVQQGMYTMHTFDSLNGFYCVYERVEYNSDTCHEALDYCQSATSPEIHLHCAS